MSHTIKFIPSGRGKAQCPADPKFPDGVDVIGTTEEPLCKIELPYPAPECGAWIVHCELCPLTVAITATGRPDDPRSATVPCALQKGKPQ